MTCDRLVCANCAGLVSEGRCPVCRASRERLHRSAAPGPAMIAALVLIAVALVLIAARLGGA